MSESGIYINRALILCTKNTVRSTIGEAAFNQEAEELGVSVRSVSAGVSTPDKGYVIPEVVKAAERVGLKIPQGYQPRRVTDDLLKAADIVLTFTPGQRDYIIDNFDHLNLRAATANEFARSKIKVVDPSTEMKTKGWQVHLLPGPIARQFLYLNSTDRNFERHKQELYDKMARDIQELMRDVVHEMVRQRMVT
jgi:protein-tyrosine-phosphatase